MLITANSRLGILTLAAATLLFSAGAQSAPITGANGHKYDIIFAPNDGTWTWVDAYHDARSRGGYLATITSAQEKADIEGHPLFLSSFGKKVFNFNFGPWLGGFVVPHASTDPNDPFAGGDTSGNRNNAADWYWINGEGRISNDFFKNPVPAPGAFNDWLPNEPNHAGGPNFDELYLAYGDENADLLNVGWADMPNEGIIANRPRVMAYVLEIPEPGTLAIFGIGLAGLGLARRRKRA